MKCLKSLFAAALTAAFIPAPALSEEKAPEAVLKAGVVDAVKSWVPDFSGLPPGTEAFEVEYVAKVAGIAVTGRFSISRSGPQRPFTQVRGGVEVLKESDRQKVTMLEKGPAGDPMDALAALLTDLHAKNLEAAGKHLVKAGDAEDMLNAFSDGAAGKAGFTLDEIARSHLPRCGALPGVCGRIEFKYSFPAEKGDLRGMMSMEAEIAAGGADPPRWLVQEAAVGFKPADPAKPMPAMPKDPCAADGLRKLVEAASMPDFAAFPAGTSGIAIGYDFDGADCIAEIEVEFKTPKEAPGILILDELKIRDKGGPEKPVYSAAPSESPIDSVRNCMKAFVDWSPDTVLKYMPEKRRKRVVEGGKSLEDLRKSLDKTVQKQGFSPPAHILANLPSLASGTVRPGKLGVEYTFPGSLKGEEGAYRVEIDLVVEPSSPECWRIDDIDSRFRKNAPADEGEGK